MLTVADQLAFDALPEETRRLCERIIEFRMDEESANCEAGYEDGFRAGNTDRDNTIADTERAKVKLEGEAKALEDQLRHHHIVPDRRFGVPPERPAIDAAPGAENPARKRKAK